jgi:uncharacterized protein DUF5670
MGNLLYIIAVILAVAWAVGFFVYAASGLIHVLLIMAFVTVVLRFVRR